MKKAKEQKRQLVLLQFETADHFSSRGELSIYPMNKCWLSWLLIESEVALMYFNFEQAEPRNRIGTLGIRVVANTENVNQ